jgi:hypothetical protein
MPTTFIHRRDACATIYLKGLREGENATYEKALCPPKSFRSSHTSGKMTKLSRWMTSS